MRRVLRPALAALTVATAIVLCVALTPVPAHADGGRLLAGLLVSVSAVIIVATIRRAFRHHQLSRALAAMGRPATIAGIRVHELQVGDGPFVAGLRRPQIFLPPDVTVSLEPDELQAVLRHERYHQLDLAPARLVLLEGLSPLLGLLPAGSAWLARRIAALEIAADRYALAQGSTRPALARALLKLGQRGQSAYGIGFASAGELRLRALLESDSSERLGRIPPWVLRVALALGVCLLFIP